MLKKTVYFIMGFIACYGVLFIIHHLIPFIIIMMKEVADDQISIRRLHSLTFCILPFYPVTAIWLGIEYLGSIIFCTEMSPGDSLCHESFYISIMNYGRVCTLIMNAFLWGVGFVFLGNWLEKESRKATKK